MISRKEVIALGYFGSGDYKDMKPMFGGTFSCPKCGAPCDSWTAAQGHCQHSWNSSMCTRCNGTGKEYGQRCSQCNGTGKVSF